MRFILIIFGELNKRNCFFGIAADGVHGTDEANIRRSADFRVDNILGAAAGGDSSAHAGPIGVDSVRDVHEHFGAGADVRAAVVARTIGRCRPAAARTFVCSSSNGT